MSIAVVQLGRAGDVLNTLPLVKHLADRDGGRPTLIVAKDFASVADSISYADVAVFPGQFNEHAAALKHFRGQFSNILTPQVYGDGISFQPFTESFCVESYHRAGYLVAFLRGDFDRITIDKRHTDETELVQKTIPDNRLPNILVNLTSGYSSPFHFAKVFQHRIEKLFQGRANVIDLSKIRAKRFADLLGLYDRAQLLITADTGTLHLAGAHDIPYIAFITDRPNVWYGAYTRGNCIARIRYSSSPMWSQTVDKLCDNALTGLSGRRFVHVYSDFKSGDQHTVRRHRIAKQTWRLNAALGNWQDFPVRDDELPRLFQDRGRALPYIKDLLDHAASRVRETDILVLTNTDTCFGTDLTELLNYNQFLVGRRRDFPQLVDPLSPVEVRRGSSYVGADLFAIPVGWWKQHRDEMPDMVAGCEGWDAVLAQLMLRYGAEETWDFIYHERHPSHWERSDNKYSLPGQLHNLRLAFPTLKQWGVEPWQFGIKQV